MKRTILYGFAVLLPALAILLWPLKSGSWAIEWNDERIEAKEAYLASEGSVPNEAPNVLLIMVDDLSKADMTMYFDDSPVSTPNMDRIATEGVRFENAYVTAPICSPSRAAVVTGRYPQRFGYEYQMHDRYLKNRLEYLGFRYFIDSDPWIPQAPAPVPNDSAIAEQGLPKGEISIAEIMQKHGYATGIVGKWHLGTAEHNLPCNLGFDYFYGFNASHSLYIPENTPGYVDQRIEDDWTDDYIWSGQRTGAHAVCENCVPVDEDEYLTDKIADEAIDYMERNRDRPFFLWASFNAPHTPLQAPVEYVEMYAHVEDPVKRVHYAMIKSLDDAIGRVNQYLVESGLDSNTLVFFISDNGGAHYNLTTDNGPYRGGKITNFEGGVKVPMAVRWPGVIAPGQSYAHMVSSMDIFGTVVSALSVELPRDRVYDGVDLLTAIADSTPAHEYLYWRMGYNNVIRTAEWKCTWNTFTNTRYLYNIATDPYELNFIPGGNNLVADELMQQHARWCEELEDPLWPSVIHFTYADGGRVYYFDD